MKSGFLRHRKGIFKPESANSDEDRQPKPQPFTPYPWWLSFLLLLVSRCLSARSNIIHDCDETFNYWEPLHYLLHGNGFQTWEYSSEFGLRSYLYLLFHAAVLFPASILFGNGANKFLSFYALRFLLAILSAASESYLVAAVGRLLGRRVGACSLLILCFASGSFTASTTFLPSTLSMYTLSTATGLLLDNQPAAAVSVAAVGVLIGWPFAVLATVPLVLSALCKSFQKVLVAGAATSATILLASVLVDTYFYGRWTCSVVNLVWYNALGGGDSSLYGTEGPFFYLRNMATNFNLVLPLGLAAPLILPASAPSAARWKPWIAIAPLFLWMPFMSLQAHKEERFMYVIYPTLCVSAAMTLGLFVKAIPAALRTAGTIKAAKALRVAAMIVIVWLSYARSCALLTYYNAPMLIYNHLPAGPSLSTDRVVCVGSEWHRFPSHFFLPSPHYKLRFLDDGFRGLLPFPFNVSAGGTSSSPPYYNSANVASPGQFVPSESLCDYLVELDLQRPSFTARGSNTTIWRVIKELPFLDNEMSPPLHRALLVPGVSMGHNVFGVYRLMERNV